MKSFIINATHSIIIIKTYYNIMLFVLVPVYGSVWMHCSVYEPCPLMCILNNTCTKQRLPSCRRKNELSVCLTSDI